MSWLGNNPRNFASAASHIDFAVAGEYREETNLMRPASLSIQRRRQVTVAGVRMDASTQVHTQKKKMVGTAGFEPATT
jgi:hypothetical protein